MEINCVEIQCWPDEYPRMREEKDQSKDRLKK